jgi:hypothetical protein
MRTEYQIQVMRIRSHARAEAQLDMVTSLSAILDAGAQSKEAVALRVFQALEATAADPLTRQLLPGETINMLQMLHNWLVTEGEFAPPSNTAGPGGRPNRPQGGA